MQKKNMLLFTGKLNLKLMMAIALLGLSCCCIKKKAPKETASQPASTLNESKPPPTSMEPAENQPTAQQQQEGQDAAAENYRLVVSFYSIGGGTDGAAHQKFKQFLENFKPQVNFEYTPWGREGEKDYCFKLSELSPEKQQQFVAEAKKAVSGSERVHVVENSPCLHKR